MISMKIEITSMIQKKQFQRFCRINDFVETIRGNSQKQSKCTPDICEVLDLGINLS